MKRHKLRTNSNDNNNIKNPENAKEIRPAINPGSTVISTTVTIIDTKTNNGVRFKIMEIPPLFDTTIITILYLIGIPYFGKIKNIPTKKIKVPTDNVR